MRGKVSLAHARWWPLLALPLATVAALVLFLAWGHTTSRTADATGPGEMSLDVEGALACDAPDKPTKCDVELDTKFFLTVDVNQLPETPSGTPGYRGVQVQVVYGFLDYQKAPDPCDELTWPDKHALCQRSQLFGSVLIFDTSTNLGNDVSTHVGEVVRFSMNCSTSPNSFKVGLTAYDPVNNPNGSGFRDADDSPVPAKAIGTQELDINGDTDPETVDIADTLTINCVPAPTATATPTPAPTPTPTPTPVGGPKPPCPTIPNLPFPQAGCDQERSEASHTVNFTNPPFGTLTCTFPASPTANTQITRTAVGDAQPNGLDDIQTEITWMVLQGTCQPGGATVIVKESETLASTGQVEEQTNTTAGLDFPAQSFFNVYVEVIDVGSGFTIHNRASEPVIMECKPITRIPPFDCEYTATNVPVPLYDETETTQVGELTSASHLLVEKPAVGGIVELPDEPGSAAQTSGSDGSAGIIVGLAAGAAAALLALSGAAWYARRRRVR